jgi:uncharacterized repeat protein (TIGR01451 family)
MKDLTLIETAVNLSQGNIQASSTVAESGDQISYTLSITNKTLKSITTTPELRLADILEYSETIDISDGSFDAKTNTLSWDQITINPNSTHTRTFVVRLFDNIPVTARGKNYKQSYDCIMASSFGNTINIEVSQPFAKRIESIYLAIPSTNSPQLIIISSIIFIAITFSYLKTRQTKREIQIIRRNANTGTL